MATDAQNLNYILSNPDLRENAEAAGLTQSEMIEMAIWHWDTYGKNEGRQNTVEEITNDSGYTETLSDIHYQGRTAEDVLEASVQAGAGSQMWDVREGLDSNWNIQGFDATGWNMDQDNPYYSGILGNTIAVDTGVGQLYDIGDNLFVQDRYNQDSLANDFLDDWVTDNKWTGPDWGTNYWDVLTTTERDADGNLRATIPRADTGWNTSGSGSDSDSTSGDGDQTDSESGPAGSADLLTYRPWTKNYWSEYISPDAQGLLYHDKNNIQREYGIGYLPGEHRDPFNWGKWESKHEGHIPGGGWRFSPETYRVGVGPRKGEYAPWRFSAPAGPTPESVTYNVDFAPWNATSMNLTPAQGTGWQGFLSGLGDTPTINTTTKTLLGV